MKHSLRPTLFVLAFAVAALLVRPALAASPPQLNPIGNQTVLEGSTLTFTVTATDSDGDSLTYFPPVLPPGAHFDVSTQTFNWTPTFSQSGAYPGITFGVSDGTTYVSETITITVSNVDRTPVAAAGGPYSGVVGTPVLVSSAQSADPDGTSLTSSWNFGDGATGTGALTTHLYGAPGTYAVQVTVSDGGHTATASTTATISAKTDTAGPSTHGPAVGIELAPSSTSVTSGSSTSFVAIAHDAVGNHWDVTAGTGFSTNDPRGSITAATYIAGTEGTWSVQGDYGGILASATVSVTPGAIARIVVNPSSNPETVPRGTSQEFSAVAFDAASNQVPSATFTWSVGGAIGTVGPNGRFTASRVGSGSVAATSSSVTGSSFVQVMPVPAIAGGSTIAPPQTKKIGALPSQAPAAGIVLGTESQNPAPATPTNSSACSSLAWWGWLGILVGYLLVLVGVLYATRRVHGKILWVLPLALTAALLWGFFRYRCGSGSAWFPWLVIVGGLIVALFRPLPPEEPPPPLPSAQPSML